MSKLNPYTVLYVDDEALALKYFEKGFANDFQILTASSASEGWEIIRQRHSEIGVLMSDQRMPGQTGVELLERVRRTYPSIIRILVTAYSDLDSAIAGVNEGAIYRYVSKPWDVSDLRLNLLRALEYFTVLVERDRLVQEKLSTLQQIVLSDQTKNLGVLAAGLSSHFRNALQAASRFKAAIPPDIAEASAPGSAQGPIGKNLESLVKQSSRHVFQLASSMKELAEDPVSFSAEPIPLPDLLAPLSQGEWLPQSIGLKIDSTVPPLKVNERQFTKLFILLASNLMAVAGQSVSVGLEARETTGPSGARSVRLLLSDDGPDWTPEQQVRFFAPFSSTRDDFQPLGLDLAVCYFLVHHHGGQIDVIGKANPRVVIELPLDPALSESGSWEQSQLDQLFHRERSWEEFLTPLTREESR